MNVQFEQRPSLHGYQIGIATLDSAKSLNALSLPMIEALWQQLSTWANDDTICAVVLRGDGAKAFCAGGDVVDLVHACRAEPGSVPNLAARFFADEYRLDHLIHTYPKPFICWAHGYVMGGGMGLMQGASTRIVTPSTRLAMPEISIGLFPDVGGSWFLTRLPGKLGLFLALTAAHINAADALALNLADRFLLDEQLDALLAGLVQINWQERANEQLISLLQALEHEARSQLPDTQWLPRQTQINQLLDVPDAASAWDAIATLVDSDDNLLARAGKTLVNGCPLTAALVWAQLEHAKHLSLGGVFRMEYAMALNCCRHPEFAEGVRARLIDKDQQPAWHWPDIHSIPAAVVEAHFASAWQGAHPLAELTP
ncbi:Enoyl-CoA hydratase/carnithine racemase [Atopomonas hussainii]|uniref:3-hydroxyisobutyryl-CoA hydrolase n=1 Tax=Atopomonas hussainii TaxID=1429083 RepID=A0A1H7K2W6_9GAMM|nr:enoyl-CoA hydratase/isomerase family protein [Atopomonas hussainii]SEK81198.1 Enoyl-CoA hydratase/carnithine racemase [Atopomonas hussainii]